jgi:hypothetical protein
MKKQRFTWDTWPGDQLKYGKPCRPQAHQDSQGWSLRTEAGHCLACVFRLPAGLFEHSKTDVAPARRISKYNSADEARQAHVDRQKEWNKNNPEKFRAAQKRYHASEKYRARVKDRYLNLSEEKREIMREKQRQYYARKRLALAEQQKEPT